MRLRSRDFQDSPMENISTSLDESYRNSPRASGGHDHLRDSNRTLSHFSHFKQSGSSLNPRLPHGRIKTSKMNNYFQNNASSPRFEIAKAQMQQIFTQEDESETGFDFADQKPLKTFFKTENKP